MTGLPDLAAGLSANTAGTVGHPRNSANFVDDPIVHLLQQLIRQIRGVSIVRSATTNS